MSFRSTLTVTMYPSPTETGDLTHLKAILCAHEFQAQIEADPDWPRDQSGQGPRHVDAASHFDQGGSPFFVDWVILEQSETSVNEVVSDVAVAVEEYMKTCFASRQPAMTLASGPSLSGPTFEAHWDDRFWICAPWMRQKIVVITSTHEIGAVVPVSVVEMAAQQDPAEGMRSVLAHTYPDHRAILERARELEEDLAPEITDSGDFQLLRPWLQSVLKSGSGRLVGPELKAEVQRFLDGEAAKADLEELVVVHGSWGDGFAIHGPFTDPEAAQKWATTETGGGEAWWLAVINDPHAE